MKLDIDVTLTPRQIAQAFCDLGDEDQAQFFIECAAIAATWREGDPNALPSYQWHVVGRHLRTCECSTYEARAMVEEIAGGIAEAV